MVGFKRIMVPLDGSNLAERALPYARSLAQKYESQIVLLRVVDIPVLVTPIVYPEAPAAQLVEIHEMARQEAEQYLKQQGNELRQAGFDVRILMGEGSPADEIINVAASENVDLIVMSTHGRSGITRWALGSVADKIAHEGPCPVLLIRRGVGKEEPT